MTTPDEAHDSQPDPAKPDPVEPVWREIPAESKPRRRRWRWLLAAVAGIAIAGLAAGYYAALARIESLTEARLAPLADRLDELAARPIPALPADLVVLDGRIAVLEAEVTELAVAPIADPALAARLEGVEQAILDLDRRLTELASAAPGATAPTMPNDSIDDSTDDRLDDLAARLDDLATRTATTEAAVSAATQRLDETPQSALVLAVGQLREAARGREPFPAALEALGAVAAGDAVIAPLLDELKGLAATGVPTVADLGASFDAALSAALAPVSAPDAPWYRRALDRLGGLITIRRVGPDAEGDDLEARLARAEAALATGSLAEAVTILDDAAPMAAWLEQARRRVALDRALDELAARALALVTAKG